jgi:uncharacterized membrane protein YhaH (DUF805 family)
MAQERSRGGARLRALRAYPLGRLAAAALLLLIMAVALRSGLPPVALDGPLTGEELPVATVMEAVVLVLLVIVMVRRRRPPANLFVSRLRDVLRSALTALALAVPAGYGLTRTIRIARHPHIVKLFPGRTGQGRFRLAKHTSSWLEVVAILVNVLLAILLLAAIITAAVMLVRRYRRTKARRTVVRFSELPSEEDSAEQLRRALHHGWLALRALDDARGAIIACYLAMEQSLARAGTARAVAETPDELLRRASANGLVQGTAAGQLTAVFYEARFSTRELPETSRQTAEQALADLSASLGEPVP